MQRLEAFYCKHVIPFFKQNYAFDNIYEVPRLKKIVVNRGFDDSCQNSKILEILLGELNLISCQCPSLSISNCSIANFKLKKGVPIGMFVTLRGKKMYAFLDRLINLALPRIRDFQGLNPLSFDSRGNYNLGLKEQLMFPEVEFDKVLCNRWS
jgi:large subunit ribosomal protein L5